MDRSHGFSRLFGRRMIITWTSSVWLSYIAFLGHCLRSFIKVDFGTGICSHRVSQMCSSPARIPGRMKQRETRTLPWCSPAPRVPGWSKLFPSTFQARLTCFVNNVQGLLAILIRRNREKCLTTPSCPRPLVQFSSLLKTTSFYHSYVSS